MDRKPAPGVATIIAEAMDAAGLSERQLVEATGIPRTTLKRNLAFGDFKVPHLIAIATALGTAGSQILEQAERAEQVSA